MRAAAVGVLAALALVAAGCGGSSSSSMTPLELVSQAVSKTTKADSAKFQMQVTETMGPIGPITVNASGTSDQSSHSANMTMDLSSIAQLIGKGAGNPDDWKGDVIVDGSNPKAVVEYMRLPAFAKLVPGAKPWVKLNLNEVAKSNSFDFSQLLQTAGIQDPTQALQMIQSVGDVQKVGTEQLDGVDTTKYSGTIDPQKLAAKFGNGRLGQVFQAMGTKAIPITVWVDGDGYVRKLEESLTAQVPGTGTMDMKIGLQMSDFGAKVDVTPPPADQTTDLGALTKK
jgi:LppX/LprAFG-like lipoprotein